MPSVRSTICLGAALLLAGALFDTPSLYVPGIALGALAVGALAWVELSARELRVRRSPGPATAVEGELYPLRVSIERGRLPLPGGELRDPALERPMALGPNPPRVVSAQIQLGRRGRRRLEATSLVVRDPLRLCSREVQGAGAAEVLVLPRTEPILRLGDGAPGGGGRDGLLGGEGEGGDRGRSSRSAALASEIDGVRPHQDGIPASQIHWRTVARTGELFDRRLVPGAESSHAVVLDVGRPSDIDALDMAVRAAASLCLHLAPAGGCALHLPGEPRPLAVDPRLGGWPRAHVRLALVESNQGVPAPLRQGHRGLTIWVSSGTAVLTPRELARIAARASHLVTPSAIPMLAGVFTVAGCTGHSLGPARRPSLAREAEAA
jgi:uncharacterized protein (DUF58 family)